VQVGEVQESERHARVEGSERRAAIEAPRGSVARVMEPGQPTPRRLLVGRGLLAAGVLAIALAALNLANAGYGTAPRREFAQRRSYDMVKEDTHRAFPVTVLLGVGGLFAAMAGGHLVRGSRGA